MQGSRKGKSQVKSMSHIIGASELNARVKATEAKARAVTNTKVRQLTQAMSSLARHLRSFVRENVYKSEKVVIDTQLFGKFAVVPDPTPKLFRKKVVFQPTGLLAMVAPQSDVSLTEHI